MKKLPDGAYNFREVEEKILNFWLSKPFYKPEYDSSKQKALSTEEMKKDSREPFCIICPPPNAYGRPHLGNISGYAYQDCMARYARMNGKKVLVLPGKDHAGLEGEGVFVRDVLEKEKVYKFSLTREEFYKRIWDFNMQNKELALEDEKKIGLSADFERDIFTLDPKIVDIVLSTFVEMYDKGMIYKGTRIVNWDPKARTALADNQCEYVDAKTTFAYFKYGFVEPEKKAIEIKESYEGKKVSINICKKDIEEGEDSENNIAECVYGVLEGEDTEVVGVGYEDGEGETYEGIVVGIEMRLDGKFRVVVKSEEIDNDKMKSTLDKIFLQNLGSISGVHYILFDDYKEEKFYNNGFILGTVRPETKFGDTAIAVNPNDKRYKDIVGKSFKVRTLIGEAELKIVSDEVVDKEFGSGMVKVTPAHSSDDYDIASRHPEECLPAKQVIGYDLKLNHLTGRYEGLKVKEARGVIIDDMKKEGMLVSVDENYTNRIRVSERTKAEIEPLLSSQWYIKVESLIEPVINMVKSGEVKIHPKNMERKFFHWMENLNDWAISRSLWWGYRMPVWYKGEISEKVDNEGQVATFINLNGKETLLDVNNKEHMRVQIESPGEEWIQEESVLDTWFSSGQWPFATLTVYDLMDTFYPTTVMETGYDILENWVSRMMMFSYFKHGKIPFKHIYLHGLVKGKDGQKMSKSKGNVIPLDEAGNDYGFDSLRMVYFYQNKAGASYSLTYDKLKNFRNFNNKLWNASKFVMMNLEDAVDKSWFEVIEKSLDVSELTDLIDEGDININLEENDLDELNKIRKQEERWNEAFEKFRFGKITEELYHSFWHEFCDVCIEERKKIIKDNEKGKESAQFLLFIGLKTYLKMLHPFIPYITEEIWQHLIYNCAYEQPMMYIKHK